MMITLSDIEAARAPISEQVRTTPVMTVAATRNPLPASAEVVLKLELLRVTGSFKARGVMNRYLADPNEKSKAGIVTASGGNHGLAVARTANAADARATVFAPTSVRPEKVDRMRGWNAGLSTVVRSLAPSVAVIGVEPEGSPTLKASMDAGHVVRLPEVTSRVATMSCRQTDDRIFDIVDKQVDDILLVSDEDMLDASRWLWSEFAIVADLSGAASIVALRRWPQRFDKYKKIYALICGAGPDGIGN